MKRISIHPAALLPLVYLFLYAPIAVVLIFSFNSSRYGMAWERFTLHWYRELRHDPSVILYLKNTLILAGVSTALSTALGTLLGLGLSRYRFSGQRFLQELVYWPLFLPDISMAVAFLLFFALLRRWFPFFSPGLGPMIVAHVTFQIPFVALIVRSGWEGLDPSLEEAARDLGADDWQTFRRITLPLLWPAVLAGSLLAFTLSLDDFIISFFTSGPGTTTLPIYIYSSVKRGVTPEIHALATLVMAASTFSILGWAALQARQNRTSTFPQARRRPQIDET